MTKTSERQLRKNKEYLEKKKQDDPEWAAERKAYMKDYHKKLLAENRQDPEWLEKEQARQRKIKQEQRADPDRGDILRESENRRHHHRYETDPEYREQKLRDVVKKYGITLDEYYGMLEKQGSVCAICSKPETRITKGTLCRLSIDHDHETGKVRGLLCSACNTAIGQFNDDPSLVRKGLDYLLSHGGSDGT